MVLKNPKDIGWYQESDTATLQRKWYTVMWSAPGNDSTTTMDENDDGHTNPYVNLLDECYDNTAEPVTTETNTNLWQNARRYSTTSSGADKQDDRCPQMTHYRPRMTALPTWSTICLESR